MVICSAPYMRREPFIDAAMAIATKASPWETVWEAEAVETPSYGARYE